MSFTALTAQEPAKCADKCDNLSCRKAFLRQLSQAIETSPLVVFFEPLSV